MQQRAAGLDLPFLLIQKEKSELRILDGYAFFKGPIIRLMNQKEFFRTTHFCKIQVLSRKKQEEQREIT